MHSLPTIKAQLSKVWSPGETPAGRRCIALQPSRKPLWPTGSPRTRCIRSVLPKCPTVALAEPLDYFGCINITRIVISCATFLYILGS
ncbi:hypothetical protein [Moorena producens]|uniref:hypothetical protein n=1 Tax=Moorena producens TaxID=1155739 RepID=UPI0011EA676A|nr:hypothetical protein [Moorena producens]